MASYRKRGKTWRAEVYVGGKRESRTFTVKAEAVAWATRREVELEGSVLPDKTLGDALKRYAEHVSPTKRGARWEILRLKLLARDALAAVRIAALSPADMAGWRDRRLQAVSGASVLREMNLLQSVLGVARREWVWMRHNPLDGVKKPTEPPSRKRRITEDEIRRLCHALGYLGGKPQLVSHRVALAFLFALETAMRSGEILGIRWQDVGAMSVRLPRTKNGDERQVPLSQRAREILELLPLGFGPVFDLESSQRDTLFRKARKRAGIDNLHFHDARAEAIWRLSKNLDVLELARVIGHRDLKSLLLYYSASADDLAAKLG